MADPKIVEGDRIRITRVDACGRPVYGECNSVVTDGLVTIKLTPEVQEGEAKQTTNFAGRNCINRPGKDVVSYWSVEIVWCAINFAAFSMINPTYRLRYNDAGEVIGYYASNEVDDSAGYAVEIWAQVDGAADACSGESAEGAWAYIPVPWIAGGTPGEIAIGGEDSVTFTTTGKTRDGSRWGRGPYNVEIVNGIPAPLGLALDPDEPYGFIVTTVPPPEIDSECQEVPRPVPDPAGLFVEGVVGEDPRMSVRLRVDNAGLGPVTVDWGDGTPVQDVTDLSTTVHTYATTGEMIVTVCDQQDVEVCSTKALTIPLPPDAPTITATTTPSAEHRYRVTAVVSVPDQSDGRVTINWGDGGPTTDATVDPITGTATVIHDYKAPNRYTIVVRRADKTSFSARQVINVTGVVEAPPAAPTGVIGDDETATTMTVNWIWAQGGGTPATGFQIRRRTPAGTGTWTTAQNVSATARTLAVTGLTASTEYEFEVVAVGAGGNSAPATGTGTTTA